MGKESIAEQLRPIGGPSQRQAADAHIKFVLEFPAAFRVNRVPDYLVKGWLPSSGITVLYGRPGAGKSFVAVDVALHVASGRPWAGRKTRAAGVIYVASEAGGGLRKRVIAALRHHGIDASSLPFALVTVAPDLGSREGETERLIKDIRSQIPSGFDPGLVILDTLARSMVGGDETGAGGMGIFVENAERLSWALGAAVMPIHHMGKDAERGMRGSSALLGAANAVWEIDPNTPGRIHLLKMKEHEAGSKLDFSLAQRHIDVDDDGDPITSCVVSVRPADEADPPTAPAPAVAQTEPGLPPPTEAFAAALRSVIERHGAPVRRFRLIPPDAKVMKQADLRHHAAALSVAGTTEKSRRSITDKHIRILEQFGLIHRHKGHVWLAADPAVTT